MINPESRVKAARGPAAARLQQAGHTPFVIKVVNQAALTRPLRVHSPQAGQVYAGMSTLSAERMQRQRLRETDVREADPSRFLHLEMHRAPPMTEALSGLVAEYAIVLVYSSVAGRKEATLAFDVGQGTQDLGFRGETAVLFDIQPAVAAALRILDHDGTPTGARLRFRDLAGHVLPPQAKRLAPDFFFQEQIYRRDGQTVFLPPGEVDLEYSRGPEYRALTRRVRIDAGTPSEIALRLERWVDPAAHGFYSGDHHIHGAGCAHYTSPTEGVSPEDMFLQVLGEGLNVGCVLTWGPCFDFQRRFFSPGVDKLSEPLTILKYDIEVSGFGSEALGHVCLLNLKDQSYPGSEGTKTKGWPRWTTPVMRWAKAQGAVVGYAHSASGLAVDAPRASAQLFADHDADRDRLLTLAESEAALLPEPFAAIDRDGDRALDRAELEASHERAADRLPNLAIPAMDGVGAMEIFVTAALGLCDFTSAMDTPRIAEWNHWYHLLNCGLAVKGSGETDFPCMSGSRVGQGRVYVRLGAIQRLDFTAWCEGLRAGRSYVSDGFAHALEFSVEGVRPGEGVVQIATPRAAAIRATVAFAPRTPRAVAHGGITPPGGARWVGDTVTFHGDPPTEIDEGGARRVELIVNGSAVASQEVPADGKPHELRFETHVDRSSWIALRQFPQLHTNPVDVLVAGKPIRASRASARWCLGVIDQLWRTRAGAIPEPERAEAHAAFEEARAVYRRIAAESER